MKPSVLCLLVLASLLPAGLQAQDCDLCKTVPGSTNFLPPDTAQAYLDRYTEKYWVTPSQRDKHPRFLEFSRDAFEQFYTLNFVNKPGTYGGMNVCLVDFGSQQVPGQRNPDEIGLVLAPRGMDCKIDPNGYLVMNNSIDSTLKPGQPVRPVTGKLYAQYVQRFEKQYRNTPSAQKRYSLSLFLKTEICTFIHEYFLQHPDADGLAVYPAVYGWMNGVCGLDNPEQISMILVPVVKGAHDFRAFGLFKSDILPSGGNGGALNHGSLCPNICY